MQKSRNNKINYFFLQFIKVGTARIGIDNFCMTFMIIARSVYFLICRCLLHIVGIIF